MTLELSTERTVLPVSRRNFLRAAAALGAQTLLARERSRIVSGVERAPDEPPSPWDSADGFQISGARRLALPILADGEIAVAQVSYGTMGAIVSIDGVAPAGDAVAIEMPDAVYVLRHGRQTRVSLRDLAFDEAGDREHSGLVRAPMHGKVLSLLVEQGASVKRGQRLAIIEAMKMEHTLTAPVDGVVAEIAVTQDAQLAEGAKVMLITAAEVMPED